MEKDTELQLGNPELRTLAEERLNLKNNAAGASRQHAESQKLVHELQVHQIELEMQNEELRQARDKWQAMEVLLGKYSDLYDFAPVGYFNLDREGIIRAVNLTGAGFLGVERSLLISRHLDFFISTETRLVFHEFLHKIFASETKETCELVFMKETYSPIIVHVEAVVSESGQECRAVVIDITERKRAEEALGQLNQELEQRVRERTAELERKIYELEQLNKAFVGRELRMVELKEKIRKLEEKLS